MRKLVTPLVLCFCAQFIVLQNSNMQAQSPIDSLRHLTQVETDFYELANIYYDIADHYYYSNFDSALFYAEKYLEMSELANDSSYIADAYNYIAYIYDQAGEVTLAKENFMKALELFLDLDDQYQIANSYINLGYIISYGIDQPGGLTYLLKSLQIAEDLQDSVLISAASCNIAYFYERLKDYGTAYQFYKRSLDIDISEGDSLYTTFSYANMALINLRIENFPEMERNLEKSKSLISSKITDYDLTYLYTSYIDAYIEVNLVDSIRLYISLVDELLAKNSFKLISSYLEIQKGHLAYIEKNYWKCIDYLNKGLKSYESIGIAEPFSEVYKKIAEAYSNLGMFEKAYGAQLKSIAYLDSLNYGGVAAILSKNEQERIGKILMEKSKLEFELEKNEMMLDSLRTKMNLKISLISLILILILCALVFYFMIKLRSKNKLLNSQYEKIQENNILLELNIGKVRKREEELETLNATKDKFFSIIAHDLRNPLSSIIGLSDMFLSGNLKYNSKEMLNLMESMKSTANYGFNLLENLLEWAISNTGNMEANQVKTDLNAALERQIECATEIAGKKGIRFEYLQNDPIFVFADENMLSVILRNLLHNAVKFSHENGRIIVDYKVKKDAVYIYIEDFGIGISNKEIENIFSNVICNSRFGTARERGSGLGLILCKDFVTKNSGKIWVESIVNVGSKFIFTLPLYKNQDKN